MEYEFIIRLPFPTVEEAIEKLAIEGYYNAFYDQPIEVSRNENGYDYEVTEDQDVDLHVIIPTENASDTTKKLARLLDHDTGQIKNEPYELQEWQQPIPRIEVDEEWEIVTPQHDPTPGKKQILLESMGGFGTGAHVTTRDCLRVLLHNDLTSQSVMDIGTGSGILSIAAAKKNAEKMIAIDIQPSEREVYANAELNGVERIEVQQKDLINEKPESYGKLDWVFINIGTEETIQILEQQFFFKNEVEHFLISGVVEWSHGKLLDYFERYGYEAVEKHINDEWMTIHFMRK
ncbi:50S ribosomal protein L11 methyltransferase [Pseudalkalibacillus sp. Hm43]|uniref:50S ribosomal protein L11 methyltransferase n=1 Tax=Pseudalkalibacillus sp. Hm43 TaxID=3450742 RepID=UPI003F4250DA